MVNQLLKKLLFAIFFIFFLIQVTIILLLAYWKYYPVNASMFMLTYWLTDNNPPIQQIWVNDNNISSNIKKAVIAAEDSHFFSHQGFDWDGIHNAFEVANALNAKNNTMLEDDVFAMQNKFEQSNELSYFENNLLFKDQDMIANNELFLPLIKELLIPMLEQFDKYEI